MKPKNIKLSKSKLVLIQQDDSATELSLKYLRDECPCANCKGETILWKTSCNRSVYCPLFIPSKRWAGSNKLAKNRTDEIVYITFITKEDISTCRSKSAWAEEGITLRRFGGPIHADCYLPRIFYSIGRWTQ